MLKDKTTKRQRKNRAKKLDLKWQNENTFLPVKLPKTWGSMKGEKEVSEAIQRSKVLDRKYQIHADDWEVVEEIRLSGQTYNADTAVAIDQIGRKTNELVRAVNGIRKLLKQLLP